MTAYETARAALDALNARFWAVTERSRVVALDDAAEWEAISVERFAIRDAAKANGFIRIFDGSYKLDVNKY